MRKLFGTFEKRAPDPQKRCHDQFVTLKVQFFLWLNANTSIKSNLPSRSAKKVAVVASMVRCHHIDQA